MTLRLCSVSDVVCLLQVIHAQAHTGPTCGMVLQPRFELLWKRDLLSDQSVALRALALDSRSFHASARGVARP